MTIWREARERENTEEKEKVECKILGFRGCSFIQQQLFCGYRAPCFVPGIVLGFWDISLALTDFTGLVERKSQQCSDVLRATQTSAITVVGSRGWRRRREGEAGFPD